MRTFVLYTLLNSPAISGKYIGELKADLMATLYDVGGIIGDVTLSS